MPIECCIAYVYHTRGKPTKDLVIDHYHRLVDCNRDFAVVPLTCGYEHWIPDTIDVKDIQCNYRDPFAAGRDQDKELWHHNDQVLWRYLKTPDHIVASRYILFDWDVFCYKMSVKEFYKDVWDADAASINVPTPESHPWWVWWGVWPSRLPKDLLFGMLPFCGSMFSRRVAEKLAVFNPNDIAPGFVDANTEFRTGASVRYLGYEIASLRSRETMLHTYGGPSRLRDEPGIYHPVPRLTRFHV